VAILFAGEDRSEIIEAQQESQNRKQEMRQIKFTEEEITQLKYESLYHKHALVRRRMQALLLKAEGLSHAKIGEIVDICPTTLRKYFDTFLNGAEAGRVEALKELKYKGKPNRLMEKKVEIIAHLEENPPATQKEAQAKIKELTGIQRSLPQVREFLKKTRFVVAR
jgi:transposase